MTDTTDFEYLLDKPHVNGVEYDEENDRVIVFVDKKIPEDELPPDAIISTQVDRDQDSDVKEAGGDFWLEGNPRRKHRPITAGLSEGPVQRRIGGTGGPVAKVTNPDRGYWRSDVSKGDLVRISNCHVYADSRSRQGLFGDEICQPARIDGGGSQNVVGELVGYIPMIDPMPVDCAARTIDERDENGVFDLGEDVPSGVRRDYSDFNGETGRKSGRTTNVTSGTVEATSATIRVRIDEDRTITFRDQIITTDMSKGGDSGSDLLDEKDWLSGLLFAGSSRLTVFNKIARVEEEFGVEMLTEPIHEEPEEPEEPDEPDETPVEDPLPDPEPGPQTLKVGSAGILGTTEYSFRVDPDSEVEFSGRSTSQVGNTVNGWVAGWSNSYSINGHLEAAAIPETAAVSINGYEVDPSDAVEVSKRLAGVQ